jgi:hypothetical protein
MSKNLKFALLNTSTTNPVDSAQIYHSALIKGGSKSLFTAIVDAKDKTRIKKHDFGDVLQADGCTFSPSGEGTLSEKLVDLCTIKVNLEFCQSILESSFVSNQMRSGANSADFLPADFQAYVVDQLAKKMDADFETLVWQGAVASTGSSYPIPLCDGLLAQFAADGTVVDVTATTITSSNVVAEIARVYDAIPEAVKFSPEMRIFVSTNVLAAYKQAIAAASAESYYTKDAEPTFLGIPLVLAQGLPNNRMVAAELTNLFLVTDLVSDYDDIKLLPQGDVTGDDTIRVKGRVKFAVAYAFGGEIVAYA